MKSTTDTTFIPRQVAIFKALAQESRLQMVRQLGRQDHTVGELTALTAKEAHEGGMKEDQIIAFDQREEASEFLRENTRPGDCLLFKGSRGSGMEKVLKELIHPEAF